MENYCPASNKKASWPHNKPEGQFLNVHVIEFYNFFLFQHQNSGKGIRGKLLKTFFLIKAF